LPSAPTLTGTVLKRLKVTKENLIILRRLLAREIRKKRAIQVKKLMEIMRKAKSRMAVKGMKKKRRKAFRFQKPNSEKPV
jgi:hypothetical protein